MTHALYTAEQTRRIEQRAFKQLKRKSFAVMQRAGEAAFAVINERIDARRWLVLCGVGNNGGDGYIVAALALAQHKDVTVLAAGEPKTDDARAARDKFIKAGGKISEHADDKYDVVVDAIFGIGLDRAPSVAAAKLIQLGNGHTAYKVALDLPSGLHADTGVAFSPTFVADVTPFFVAAKLGMFTADAFDVCGEKVFCDLGFPREAYQVTPIAELTRAPKFLKRMQNTHKGDFGRVLVIGGDPGMYGAALLASETALRAGAGLVTLLTKKDHVDSPAMHRPELLGVCVEQRRQWMDARTRADAIVIGPGLTASASSDALCRRIASGDAPTVFDAGALHWLADHPGKLPPAIVTPHPGEAAALLQTKTETIQHDRVSACVRIAEMARGVCILKGAGTVIANAAGRIKICEHGNAGMATAGMGDVLSGLLAALLARGESLLDAAEYGVYLHAKSADACVEQVGEAGLIASDVMRQLPLEIKRATLE